MGMFQVAGTSGSAQDADLRARVDAAFVKISALTKNQVHQDAALKRLQDEVYALHLQMEGR